MGHDELLSMIKYGADTIFTSKDSTITDEDIDAVSYFPCFYCLVFFSRFHNLLNRSKILSKGEEKTQKLNEKIKDHSKKLIDFSTDGMNVSFITYLLLYITDQGDMEFRWCRLFPNWTKKTELLPFLDRAN